MIKRRCILIIISLLFLISYTKSVLAISAPTNLKQYIGPLYFSKEIPIGGWLRKYDTPQVTLKADVQSGGAGNTFAQFEVRKFDEAFINANNSVNVYGGGNWAYYNVDNSGSPYLATLWEGRYKWQARAVRRYYDSSLGYQVNEYSPWVQFNNGANFHFGIDVTPPTVNNVLVSGKTPDNGSIIRRGKILISARSADNFSGLKAINFFLQNNGSLLYSSAVSPASFLWNSGNLNGWYIISIRPVDIAGSTTKPPDAAAGDINILLDNYSPRTFARVAYNGRKGKVYSRSLNWRVEDPYTNEKAFVWLVIQKKVKKKSKRKGKAKYYYKTVKKPNFGLTLVNKYNGTTNRWESVWRGYKFKTSSRGKFRFKVYAKDRAGNSQRNIATAYFDI